MLGGWDKLGEIWRSQICRFCGAGLRRILATGEFFFSLKTIIFGIVGNCMSIFQNSLRERDLCTRKNSTGTF